MEVAEEVVEEIAVVSNSVAPKTSMRSLTQITFKQVFENLLYQEVKEIDGNVIPIFPNVRNYFVHLSKERIDFFTEVDNVLKIIILPSGTIELKNMSSLLALVKKAYINLGEDKKHHFKLVEALLPDEVIVLLFRILLMLFISTNGLPAVGLLEECMELVSMAMELINLKQIKTTMFQKVKHRLQTSPSFD